MRSAVSRDEIAEAHRTNSFWLIATQHTDDCWSSDIRDCTPPLCQGIYGQYDNNDDNVKNCLLPRLNDEPKGCSVSG